MFTFGIGSSVNRFLIEGMARVGLGEPFVVTKPEDAAEQADKFRQYIQLPVLTQIACNFNGFDAYDVEPVSIPDVLARRPVLVFGKWRGAAAGEIELTGMTGSGEYRQTFRVSDAERSGKNAALRYLWARKRIELLSDYNKLQKDNTRAKEITRLGLTYSLLTEYTSFIAVDDVIRNKTGQNDTVKQPVPLPQNVSNSAIGVRKSPEPELSLLLLIAAALVTFALRKK